jgi:hypothetical protein
MPLRIVTRGGVVLVADVDRLSGDTTDLPSPVTSKTWALAFSRLLCPRLSRSVPNIGKML